MLRKQSEIIKIRASTEEDGPKGNREEGKRVLFNCEEVEKRLGKMASALEYLANGVMSMERNREGGLHGRNPTQLRDQRSGEEEEEETVGVDVFKGQFSDLNPRSKVSVWFHIHAQFSHTVVQYISYSIFNFLID
ncbi:hypothetical protein WN51_09380 [Melipona quadrifasciata]|uniref:Uncharacterized protein n=1 Tax=Melipona quadrifasciata TaxID=166423 RepID=A0A0M9A5M6_9HYME|nr:hypothetical protein WN51_09380 [Melipona quadrifasciata]